MKALVIDDVVPIQNMLKKMLLAAGVDEVVTAATGEAGLLLLATGDIDLLLLDIHLPDMSGLDVLKKIRERNSTLYVAVATGFEEPETVQEIIRLGANHYIVKPVKRSEVKLVVEEAAR
ncbi:MAG: response regulator [Gammaproteobacteria bacterium]|jgi:DNA-binding response OmpR family regulator|nr:response regulator [Gammaproteobacteria bacterium]MBT3473648.1 response regulator [Gammaproteobacteria bacterium]MBT3966285.1 response regulator [Gammaproteobacteria bacterium]MBT5636595.1 response regulator [Gammaproteobacteria bacterium]MBT8007319.1 response regulator [Gammaproteobacteria bacterium]